MLKVNDQIEIEEWELTEQFTRSSGPGGQNVNKVSTAVELRFEAERSPNLPAHAKARLKRLAGRRWTKEGAVVLQVDETRSQARNRDIARDRLADLLRAIVWNAPNAGCRQSRRWAASGGGWRRRCSAARSRRFAAR